MNRLRILELYAGSRSFGKIAEKRGHHVFSVDIEPFEAIDLVKDIEFLERWEIPFVPNVLWASPDCSTYSIAGIWNHRRGTTPASKKAIKSDRLVKKTLEIFKWFPNSLYYMENPVGMLRKMPFMQGIPRTTVTYCTYGDMRMKPTDIWSNNIYDVFHPDGWTPRPKCFNNNPHCHHERSPRGSQGGTQRLGNSYERSKIPDELCLEIIKASEHHYKLKNALSH